MSTLKGFHQQFKDDRSMKVYAQWWDEIGGARGVRRKCVPREAFFTCTDKVCYDMTGGGRTCKNSIREGARTS